MIKLITVILIILSTTQAFAFLKGGVGTPAATIGGINVGTNGSSGIYSGYTMVGGDDFTQNPLSVLHIADPYARYADTHIYYAGARSIGGALINSYDIDPYHTGSQDSHRGVPVGTADTLLQNSSGLAIKVRVANSGETPYINSRTLVSGMVASGSYLTVTPPAIVEAYYSLSPNTGAPGGWHPTFWLQSASPLDSCDACTAPPYHAEYDVNENYSNSGYVNQGLHGNGTINFTTYPGVFNPQLSGLHLYSIVLTNSTAKVYLDGTLKETFSFDTTSPGVPYQILFTGHTFSSDGFSPSAWTAAGSTGATMLVQYYRIWVPNSQYQQIITPKQNLPNIQVNWNTAFTYTIPSLANLWNANVSGVTDYCQGLRWEDFEPGATGEGTTEYYPFPAELTWNSTTRVLSGKISLTRPGRLHTMCTPYGAGGTIGYTARGYIDIGPNITTSSISYSNGTGSFDVYPITDCGTLVPKTVSVSGLPTGLSFNPSTFLITGTATTGSYTISITTTNSSGQSVTNSSVTLTVGS